jgi:hypothetical protein
MSHEIKVTLQFNVGVNGPSSDLRFDIDRILGAWSDGRYPFSVELIRHGIEEVVAAAVRSAVDAQARGEFGDEMVATSPDSKTSRAHLEAEKILKDLAVRCRSDGRAVAAHVVDDDFEFEGEKETPKWRVLCRDDRKEDGGPGDYAMSSRVFDDAEAARAWAEGVSSSRFPIIVEAHKADTVLGALNIKNDTGWWER